MRLRLWPWLRPRLNLRLRPWLRLRGYPLGQRLRPRRHTGGLGRCCRRPNSRRGGRRPCRRRLSRRSSGPHRRGRLRRRWLETGGRRPGRRGRRWLYRRLRGCRRLPWFGRRWRNPRFWGRGLYAGSRGDTRSRSRRHRGRRYCRFDAGGRLYARLDPRRRLHPGFHSRRRLHRLNPGRPGSGCSRFDTRSRRRSRLDGRRRQRCSRFNCGRGNRGPGHRRSRHDLPLRRHLLDLLPHGRGQRLKGLGRQACPHDLPGRGYHCGGLGNGCSDGSNVGGGLNDIGPAQIGLGRGDISHRPRRRQGPALNQGRGGNAGKGRVVGDHPAGRHHVVDAGDIDVINRFVDDSLIDIGHPGDVTQGRPKGIRADPRCERGRVIGGGHIVGDISRSGVKHRYIRWWRQDRVVHIRIRRCIGLSETQ